MIVEKYDEKEFFDKSIKMLEKDYGTNFANDFKDLYIKQQEEIERLNKRIEDLNIINEEHKTLNGMIRKELQQKENIIKEVREKIRYWQQDYIETFISTDELDEILEILDKVD